jgi:uncharacterized integral membrane protein
MTSVGSGEGREPPGGRPEGTGTGPEAGPVAPDAGGPALAAPSTVSEIDRAPEVIPAPEGAQAPEVNQGPEVDQVPGPQKGRLSGKPVAPTRASGAWTALAVGMVLLVVVVVFIMENLQDVKVSFFGAHWRIPLAIDLLLAAVLGGAVVFSTGAVRLLQLRLQARRQARGRSRRGA